MCRLWVGRGEPAHSIVTGQRGGVLWYCGTWVWTGFEPRERPVRPASVKGLTSSSIVPHAPIDNLPFSVFNDARILTSGVYGSMGPRAKQLTLLLPVCTRCLGATVMTVVGIAFVVR